MKKFVVTLVLAVFMVAVVAPFWQSKTSEAQSPASKRTKRRGKKKSKGKKPPPLPNDRRLLSLHLEFVKKAEKLALEYERKKELDKAKAVYGEILKLVPQYASAKQRLDLIRQKEANAKVKQVRVLANKDWQDSGVDILVGKPVTIRAAGTWTFNLKVELGPEGIKIPKELRKYNLGCLVGAINSGSGKPEPFVVGRETSFVAKKSGRLYFRMYDVRPDDNSGNLKIEVRGTFKEGRIRKR